MKYHFHLKIYKLIKIQSCFNNKVYLKLSFRKASLSSKKHSSQLHLQNDTWIIEKPLKFLYKIYLSIAVSGFNDILLIIVTFSVDKINWKCRANFILQFLFTDPIFCICILFNWNILPLNIYCCNFN